MTCRRDASGLVQCHAHEVIALVLGAQGASGPANFLIISGGIWLTGAFAACLWLIAFYTGQRWGPAAFYLLAGPTYVGLLLAHSLALREVGGYDDLGRNWLLFAVGVTFATDTGAFLIGRQPADLRAGLLVRLAHARKPLERVEAVDAARWVLQFE